MSDCASVPPSRRCAAVSTCAGPCCRRVDDLVAAEPAGGADALPAPGHARRDRARLRHGLPRRRAVCREVQSGARRAARAVGRRRAAFRLRLAGRGGAGAADVPRRGDPFHAPGQGARRDPRGLGAARRARLRRSTAPTNWPSCAAEIAATGVAGALGLVVRLALPKGGAVLDLSGKFGAAPHDAAALLRAARPHAARLGVSFHVGSQCLDPLAWRRRAARWSAR